MHLKLDFYTPACYNGYMIAINLRKVSDSLYQKLKQRWAEESPQSGFHAFILSLLEKSVDSDCKKEEDRNA